MSSENLPTEQGPLESHAAAKVGGIDLDGHTETDMLLDFMIRYLERQEALSTETLDQSKA